MEQHALELLQRVRRRCKRSIRRRTRAAAAALLKAELERNGLQPKIYTSGPNGQTNLVVRLKGRDSSKKPLLLLNHLDVVPVDRKAWSVDPFGALIRDGYIWGRGTLDMKGVGVMQLMALVTMKKLGDRAGARHRDGVDGGRREQRRSRHQVDDRESPEEIDPEYVLDEGGMGSRDAMAPASWCSGSRWARS